MMVVGEKRRGRGVVLNKIWVSIQEENTMVYTATIVLLLQRFRRRSKTETLNAQQMRDRDSE
jgi:hypothetical protein